MALRREKVSEALPPVSKKLIRGMIPCGLVCAATLVIPQRPFFADAAPGNLSVLWQDTLWREKTFCEIRPRRDGRRGAWCEV